MSAHTPGPWFVVQMPGHGSTLCIGRRDQQQTNGTIGDAPIAQVLDGAAHWTEKYPAEANARLIAAAPELLEALKAWSNASWLAGVAPDIDSNDPFASMLAQTHAAIAKAEGRS